MSYMPPYKLDPYVAVRNPGGLPILMQRGMHDVIKKEKKKDRSLHDKFVKAFNVIAFSLTESGRMKQGHLVLTETKGYAREKEVKRLSDTPVKQRQLEKWADKLKAQYPGRYDNSWWNDPYRGVAPKPQAAPHG